MLVLGRKIRWFTCGAGSEVGEFIVTVALFSKIEMNYSGFSVYTIIIIETTTISYVQITDSYEYFHMVSVPHQIVIITRE